MRVTLEPDAAAYIQGKGGHLILFQAELTGCCGIGSAPAPMWEIGRPRRLPEEYRSFETYGVMVHVDKVLDANDQALCVQLTAVLGWRSLSLSYEGGLES
jgi:hypothetical protein